MPVVYPGSSVGYRIPTTKLMITDSFKASMEDLYNALTSQEVRTSIEAGSVGF